MDVVINHLKEKKSLQKEKIMGEKQRKLIFPGPSLKRIKEKRYSWISLLGGRQTRLIRRHAIGRAREREIFTYNLDQQP